MYKINLNLIPRYLGVALISSGFLYSCHAPKHVFSKDDVKLKIRDISTLSPLVDTLKNSSKTPYKEYFEDAVLIKLLDSAMANNFNMNIAIKQISISEEFLKQAKWENLPELFLNIGSASVTRYSKNSMDGIMMKQYLGKSFMENYSTSLSLNWEVDIWGKIKEKKQIALANYLKTKEAVQGIRSRIIADIAKSYYNLLLLDSQLEATEEILLLQKQLLEVVTHEFKQGIGTNIDVKNQRNFLQSLEDSENEIKLNIAIHENAISALVGNMPSLITNRGKLSSIRIPAKFEMGMPVELLSQRPDVRQAEYALKEAAARVEVARLDFYPSLTISADGGLNSMIASNWFNIPGSIFGSVMGSITKPLLQKRKIRTQFNQAKLVAEQTELEFKQKVMEAAKEVSDLLATSNNLNKKMVIVDGLDKRNAEILKDTELLYKNGLKDLKEILYMKQIKIQSGVDKMIATNIILNNNVNLYKAVGGGGN